ncbi:hypothetical protein JL720_12477 [Aureococcus anophagefferens]|nr:hypothetical protein JL720_12477 [Aureococcus anophagefferens]
MASLLARRGSYAVIAGSGLLCGHRLAFAEPEPEPAAGEAPTPPGIYSKGAFDPAPVEAVAELLRSAKGKSDLQYKKAEEQKKQAAERTTQKEYRAALAQATREARQAQRVEAEQTRGVQRQHMDHRAQYKASLAQETQALAGRLDEALKDGEEERRAAHEAALEKIRKETAELEQELRRESERDLQDLRLEGIKERAKVARDTTLEAVKATFSSLGAGATALLGDEKRLAALAAVGTAAAGGVFAARKFTKVMGTYVAARLQKPALVRETSRGFAVASSAFGGGRAGNLASRLSGLGRPALEKGALMAGAHFEAKLEARLLQIAESAAMTRKRGAVFRHCLFYGPPGTGKTLFAKKLAANAGMDYAVASGGDVAPLGRDAVTEMHKLFDWAKTSPRGLLLLIDEADAFVRKRSKFMSEDARNALNAFLYRTGSPNADVMVVFATNAPELFDRAIHDRVDETVFFDLPGEAERLKILKEAVEAMVAEKPPASWWRPPPATVKLDEAIDDAAIRDAAARTEGLSAREVAKLALAWQANALASEGARLTRDLFEETIESQKAQTMLKREWKALERGKKRPKAH